jgi:hypothetical protein
MLPLIAQVTFAPLLCLLAIVSHFSLVPGKCLSMRLLASNPRPCVWTPERRQHPTGASCSVVREYRGLSVDHFSSFERFFRVGQSSWDRSQSTIARGSDGQPWPVLVLKVRTSCCHFYPDDMQLEWNRSMFARGNETRSVHTSTHLAMNASNGIAPSPGVWPPTRGELPPLPHHRRSDGPPLGGIRHLLCASSGQEPALPQGARRSAIRLPRGCRFVGSGRPWVEALPPPLNARAKGRARRARAKAS